MERRLGRGLRSLLVDADTDEPQREIELDRIRPNPQQPRRTFGPAGLEELRSSIQSHGVLQPVILRAAGSGYELIAGERRWRAARLAGLRTIPAVIREGVEDEQMLELALVENVQRKDLDPIEKAQGYRALMEKLELTQDAVAQKVGLKRSTVTNHLRLLELPEAVRNAIAQGVLSMGHARALLGLESDQRQVQLMHKIVRRELSVREVERIVREESRPPEQKARKKTAFESSVPPWARDLERRMQEHLGTRVRVLPGEKERGQIVIEYYQRKELESLIAILAPAKTL
jgi:ParB family chromosome partitioning protein